MQQIQRQQLQQKLSPQQIQLMRLLQMPVTQLEQAIKDEIEKNPLLDATVRDEEPLPESSVDSGWDANEDDEDYEYNYREHIDADPNAVRREFVVTDVSSPAERLMQQLQLRHLTDREMLIATEIVGTLDDAGYVARDLALVANDMAFRQGVETSVAEVEQVLHIVQELEPAGIGARNLQECLRLQLERMDDRSNPDVATALRIVNDYFDDFASHRYEAIVRATGLSNEAIASASAVIRRLNPKPAGSTDADSNTAMAVIPDIVLTQHDGQLQFYLNDSHLPELSLNQYYVDMLHEMEGQRQNREAVQFLRANQNDAQQFIDLLQQRHDTIVRVMRYIVKHQCNYLLTGNPDLLVPMRQREVAEATGLDISTVSRMANSKYVQTDFGTIPLKECFSKGMVVEGGDEVSVEVVKQRIAEAIEAEDKREPLSDEAIARSLNTQGVPLARRTVAKYREQMGIPVARLRRMVVLILCLVSCGLQAQQSYYDSIIAVRLEAASRQQPRQLGGRVAEKPTHKSPKTKPDQSQPKQESVPVRTTVEAYMVPMWYEAFPSHRVNPGGKTDLSQLPDEINFILVRDSSDFCFPVKGAKNSPYGWRWQRGHHGVDIALRTGDPVHAAFGGTVRVAARMGGYGNCIVIRHPNGLETLYGHLSKLNVSVGQSVEAGEVIGLGGSTGNSTGPHLHFECRFLYQTFDPEWILDFSTHTLRTRRLHLDKSYFGIRQPRRGEVVDYKADKSIIRESKKRPQNKVASINQKDF